MGQYFKIRSVVTVVSPTCLRLCNTMVNTEDEKKLTNLQLVALMLLFFLWCFCG